MGVLLWGVGITVFIGLLFLGWGRFENRFGSGTYKHLLIGLGACAFGLAFAVFFASTCAESVEMGSHKAGKIVKLDRNVFHQVTSRESIAIADINEIATEDHVSYRRGQRHVSQRLVLKGNEAKFYPISAGESLKERFTELEAFLTNPQAPDYWVEENSLGSIGWISGIALLTGLFFLKKAFFDGGEFGEMKRNILKLIKAQPAKTEKDKYQLIGTLFVFAAASLVDKVVESLPLASLRGQVSRFGGGFVGMGQLSKKEIQLLLAEGSIFLYFHFEKLAAKAPANLSVLREHMFEEAVLPRFLDRNPDIFELANQRLEKYHDSEKGASTLDNPGFWFVEYLNHVMLKKQMKRLESAPHAAFRTNLSNFEHSEFYRVYRTCMETLLAEDIAELSAYEVGTLLKQAISAVTFKDDFASFAPPDKPRIEEASETADLVESNSSSVSRFLAKRR